MSYLSLGLSLNERRWRKSLPNIFKGGEGGTGQDVFVLRVVSERKTMG
jgi:hypothetical protein